MSYARPIGSLGQVAASSAAGEINGVALLLADLRGVAARGHEFMSPGFSFSRQQYETMMSQFRRREGENQDETTARVRQRYAEMSGEEVQTLIAGTIGTLGEAVVRATAIARLQVATAHERAQNHALQASIIDPARLMWDMLSQMLRNMEARRAHAASGLGFAVSVPVLVALTVGVIILGVAAIAAGTYLADQYFRVKYASSEATRICNARGGCSPEEEAQIRRTLQLGPFDGALEKAGEVIGTALVVAGIGGAVVVGGLVWFYGLGGRQWIAKKAAQARRRRLPA